MPVLAALLAPWAQLAASGRDLPAISRLELPRFVLLGPGGLELLRRLSPRLEALGCHMLHTAAQPALAQGMPGAGGAGGEGGALGELAPVGLRALRLSFATPAAVEQLGVLLPRLASLRVGCLVLSLGWVLVGFRTLKP